MVNGLDAEFEFDGANRTAFGEDGEDDLADDGRGEDGAMFEPALEGLTSTMTGRTDCLPLREVAMVLAAAPL